MAGRNLVKAYFLPKLLAGLLVGILCSNSFTSAGLTTEEVARVLVDCNTPGDTTGKYKLEDVLPMCMIATGHRDMLAEHEIFTKNDMREALSTVTHPNVTGALYRKPTIIIKQSSAPHRVPTEEEKFNLDRIDIPRPAGFSEEQWAWLISVRFMPFRRRCVRVEYRSMRLRYRTRFHAALNTLQSDFSLAPNTVSKMGLLSAIHFNRLRFFGNHPGAHGGGAFLPWHRQYLLLVENALRSIDEFACLPYWNPSYEAPLGREAGMSHFFSEDFVGDSKGYVTTGPFANWTFHVSLPSFDPIFFPFPGNRLNRDLFNPFLTAFGVRLWNDAYTEGFLSKNTYRDISWCTDMAVESFHGLTHVAMGGFMLHGEYSACDPLFFVWHTFVDKMWEEWRQSKQVELENPYTSYSSECGRSIGGFFFSPDYHAADAIMEPFGISVREGLKDISHLYRYTARETCSEEKPFCESYINQYLYCDTTSYVCVARKKVGGRCEEGKECFTRLCRAGVCMTPFSIRKLVQMYKEH